MFRLFIEGGPVFMAIITILLVCIFFSAWKAPRWVKEIGSAAFATGILSFLFGLRQMFGVLQTISLSAPDNSGLFDLVSPGVFFGGLKCGMIPLIYGILVYIVSLIVTIIQKPRL